MFRVLAVLMLEMVLKLDLQPQPKGLMKIRQAALDVCCQVYLHVYDLPGQIPKLSDVIRGHQRLCRL